MGIQGLCCLVSSSIKYLSPTTDDCLPLKPLHGCLNRMNMHYSFQILVAYGSGTGLDHLISKACGANFLCRVGMKDVTLIELRDKQSKTSSDGS